MTFSTLTRPTAAPDKSASRELLAATLRRLPRKSSSFPGRLTRRNYANTAIGKIVLQQIRTALGDWRGHRDFIKSSQVPPCDYFVTDPPFIVEFDESQHFSRAAFDHPVALSERILDGVFRFPAGGNFAAISAPWTISRLIATSAAPGTIPCAISCLWFTVLNRQSGFMPKSSRGAASMQNSDNDIETFQTLVHDRLPAR